LADLDAVLDFLQRHSAISGGVSLLGSSLGGFIALHSAAREPAIRCVITWNSPATLRGLTRDAGNDVAGLGPAFFEELDRGTLADAPKGLPRVLTVQGERDEVVPPAHGHLIWEAAQEPKRLHLIPGGDHRFTDMTHRMDALRESLAWLRRHHNGMIS
jgi:dipeptidyl aminopeptidase/acylaminoacyl peptidase